MSTVASSVRNPDPSTSTFVKQAIVPALVCPPLPLLPVPLAAVKLSCVRPTPAPARDLHRLLITPSASSDDDTHKNFSTLTQERCRVDTANLSHQSVDFTVMSTLPATDTSHSSVLDIHPVLTADNSSSIALPALPASCSQSLRQEDETAVKSAVSPIRNVSPLPLASFLDVHTSASDAVVVGLLPLHVTSVAQSVADSADDGIAVTTVANLNCTPDLADITRSSATLSTSPPPCSISPDLCSGALSLMSQPISRVVPSNENFDSGSVGNVMATSITESHAMSQSAACISEISANPISVNPVTLSISQPSTMGTSLSEIPDCDVMPLVSQKFLCEDLPSAVSPQVQHSEAPSPVDEMTSKTIDMGFEGDSVKVLASSPSSIQVLTTEIPCRLINASSRTDNEAPCSIVDLQSIESMQLEHIAQLSMRIDGLRSKIVNAETVDLDTLQGQLESLTGVIHSQGIELTIASSTARSVLDGIATLVDDTHSLHVLLTKVRDTSLEQRSLARPEVESESGSVLSTSSPIAKRHVLDPLNDESATTMIQPTITSPNSIIAKDVRGSVTSPSRSASLRLAIQHLTEPDTCDSESLVRCSASTCHVSQSDERSVSMSNALDNSSLSSAFTSLHVPEIESSQPLSDSLCAVRARLAQDRIESEIAMGDVVNEAHSAEMRANAAELCASRDALAEAISDAFRSGVSVFETEVLLLGEAEGSVVQVPVGAQLCGLGLIERIRIAAAKIYRRRALKASDSGLDKPRDWHQIMTTPEATISQFSELRARIDILKHRIAGLLSALAAARAHNEASDARRRALVVNFERLKSGALLSEDRVADAASTLAAEAASFRLEEATISSGALLQARTLLASHLKQVRTQETAKWISRLTHEKFDRDNRLPMSRAHIDGRMSTWLLELVSQATSEMRAQLTSLNVQTMAMHLAVLSAQHECRELSVAIHEAKALIFRDTQRPVPVVDSRGVGRTSHRPWPLPVTVTSGTKNDPSRFRYSPVLSGNLQFVSQGIKTNREFINVSCDNDDDGWWSQLIAEWDRCGVTERQRIFYLEGIELQRRFSNFHCNLWRSHAAVVGVSERMHSLLGLPVLPVISNFPLA